MSITRNPLTKALRFTDHATRSRLSIHKSVQHGLFQNSRSFHVSRSSKVVKPFLLADIGEGITECQLIQWFVQPGARVEQFDKLCEVQSDKASVEITSPFDGVIKKLHYEPDDMARTGKPLVDIDIQGEISEGDEAKLGGEGQEGKKSEEETRNEGKETNDSQEAAEDSGSSAQEQSQQHRPRTTGKSEGDMGSLATPAVRHLVKEHGLAIEDIEGSGKDGRVLKEDVQRHVSQQQSPSTQSQSRTQSTVTAEDRRVALTPVQTQMFKVMTKSLNIPHFLYTCTAEMNGITSIRKKLNATPTAQPAEQQKWTHLSFILKALSLALTQHPLLNSSLDISDPKKPQLIYKASHNIGIAMDTPSGLLVPVIRNVQDLNIRDIAAQVRQISEKARNNKLSPSDFTGATFTVSNIGSVGGGVVAPVISEPQVAIVGVGRSKVVPAFDEQGNIVKREELVLSWSADHRVVDGAECARCAERVKSLLEDPSSMLVELR